MKDALLVFLVSMSEAETPVEQNITLLVGGFLVSGFIISADKYMKHHQMTNFLDSIK